MITRKAVLKASLQELTAMNGELDAILRARELHRTWPDDAEALTQAKRIYMTYGDAMCLSPDEIYREITGSGNQVLG